jgi:hypothetical protein
MGEKELVLETSHSSLHIQRLGHDMAKLTSIDVQVEA